MLSTTGVDTVVIIPIGFISDHMEVMFDLDTEAEATAERLGISMRRAATVGTDPRFVAGIVDLIEERRSGGEVKALGQLAIRPDYCALDCCPAPKRPTPARPRSETD